MSIAIVPPARDLTDRLADAEAVIEALLSGQIDAVVDSRSLTPVMLSKAQDALRESEERYRRIVETASEGIWAIDEHSRTTFVNGQMARMLGYSVEEMTGMPMAALVGDIEINRAALAVAQRRTDLIIGEDLPLLRTDGTELWVQVSVAPISDADGQSRGVLVMVTDRSQYRAAEEALRSSEAQYRQIVETTTEGIMTVDLDGAILFVNRRFAEMLGYEAREMIGNSAFLYMTASARADAAGGGGVFEQRVGGVKDAHDTALLHRNGSEVHVNIAGTPCLDAHGVRTGNMAVIRDVTERRKLQAQLLVSDRMASVGTLAAGVAHEINNPLAALIANLDFVVERLAGNKGVSVSDTARDARMRDDIVPSLADAREAAERVRLIVRDLKIFSRAPREDLVGSVDVRATIESSLRMAWNEIRHRARLVKNYGRIPEVAANEGRLGQVFLNLVINAAQAMQEGSAADNELRITTRLEGERVIVDVTDTGPGISPVIINRVFDAFFTTKGAGVGTGLGLAICHRIVADIGGDLTVESELGVGTTFRVSLPIAHEDLREVVAAPPPASPVRRGRILVVDDDEMVIRSLKRILARDHEVVAMMTAREALALCAAGEQFDLILCDLMMPAMNGMQFHEELSRIAPDQAKMMIFITGGAFTERARRFLSETPTEHIEKPFQPANLRAIVQRHLR